MSQSRIIVDGVDYGLFPPPAYSLLVIKNIHDINNNKFKEPI